MAYKSAVCKGSYALGTACGCCEKCLEQKEQYQAVKNVRETLDGTAALKATIARLSAELAEARAERDALVGAAYEAAADACEDYPRTAPDRDRWEPYDEQIEYSQNCIRALTPTEATAALDRAKADARAEGMRKALELAIKRIEGSRSTEELADAEARAFDDGLSEAIACIRALEKEPIT